MPLVSAVGGPQKRHGAVGKAVLVDVPLGTIVYDTTPAEDRTSYTASTRDSGRSSATANAAAAVRLAEAQPSGRPLRTDHSRQHVQPPCREALNSETRTADDGLGKNAALTDHGTGRPTASGGLSFDSPDLSFSPWSVVGSGDSTAGSDNFSSPDNLVSDGSHSAIGGAHTRDSNDSTLQPAERPDDVDGLAFASPDLSFSAWAVVSDDTCEAGNDDDDANARDPWDSHGDREGSGIDAGSRGIVFDSPDLSFSPWDVTTLPAEPQQASQPGNVQETSSSMSSSICSKNTHSHEGILHSKLSSDTACDGGAYFPAAAAGRAGSGSSRSRADLARHGTDTESVAGSSKHEASQQMERLGTRAQLDSLPVMADLVEEGQKVVVARGGKGGRGNATYRTRPNTPASKRHESGEAGTFRPDR